MVALEPQAQRSQLRERSHRIHVRTQTRDDMRAIAADAGRFLSAWSPAQQLPAAGLGKVETGRQRAGNPERLVVHAERVIQAREATPSWVCRARWLISSFALSSSAKTPPKSSLLPSKSGSSGVSQRRRPAFRVPVRRQTVGEHALRRYRREAARLMRQARARIASEVGRGEPGLAAVARGPARKSEARRARLDTLPWRALADSQNA
jgi:hypothetical protein